MKGQSALETIRNVTSADNIFQAFWKRYESDPTSELYWWPTLSDNKKRIWSSDLYQDTAPRIARLAHYLLREGVRSDTKVAILSNTRPEWCVADLAILGAGCITASIYQSLPSADVGYILHDSDAEIVFAENEEQVEKLLKITTEEFLIPECEDRPSQSITLKLKKIITFEDTPQHPLVIQLKDILSDESLPFDAPPNGLAKKRSDLASLVYTSGTTGPPKGVMQTHGNHLTNVRQATESGAFSTDGSLFLYLPLAHSFARLIYYLGSLTTARLIFPSVSDTKTSKLDLVAIADDMREANAHVIPSVPRLFEKIASTLTGKASRPGPKAGLLRLTMANALTVYEAKNNGQKINQLVRVLFTLLAPLRKKIKAQIFGRNFLHAIAGGAKLEPSVCRFFDALEITILEGYGLTETCVATNVNLPDKRRIGSVGPPFKGVETKIDEADSEILFRGPNISSGYWNRPQATAEAWSADGWFRTGDIGKIDDDEFLYITDRKKDIIVTAGGKKVAPLMIEGKFKSCPQISQAVLFGDGKPYCIALFTLNVEATRMWLSSVEPNFAEADNLHELNVIKDMIEKEISRVNQGLASFESIKRFAILAEDFSIENALLTPTLKVKRKAVYKEYAKTISDLYRE